MSRLTLTTCVALIAVLSVDVASAVEEAQDQVKMPPGSVPAHIACSCSCSVDTEGKTEMHDIANVPNDAACRGLDQKPCRTKAGVVGQYASCQIMGVPRR